MAELVDYCLPNFGNCGPGCGEVMPALKATVDFLVNDLKEVAVSGSKDFKQNPVCFCWVNPVLCLGYYCVPCCNVAVHFRNMAKMTGRTCEAECCICCWLNCIPTFYCCYQAKVRTDFRKKYGLKGSPLLDCAHVACFPSCTSCADAVELMNQGGYKVPYCDAATNNKIMDAAGGKSDSK